MSEQPSLSDTHAWDHELRAEALRAAQRTVVIECLQFGHEWVGISFGVRQCEFCGELKGTI